MAPPAVTRQTPLLVGPEGRAVPELFPAGKRPQPPVARKLCSPNSFYHTPLITLISTGSPEELRRGKGRTTHSRLRGAVVVVVVVLLLLLLLTCSHSWHLSRFKAPPWGCQGRGLLWASDKMGEDVGPRSGPLRSWLPAPAPPALFQGSKGRREWGRAGGGLVVRPVAPRVLLHGLRSGGPRVSHVTAECLRLPSCKMGIRRVEP